MNYKIRKNLFSYNLGMGLVFFIFAIFCTAILFYFLSWKISVINILLSVLLVVIFWIVLDRKRLTYYLIFLFGLFVASMFVSNRFYDFSGDGQSYQQAGIIQVALDWNPLKELIVPDVWDSTHSIWMNHFPRFSWIVHGVIYKALGRLEMSKVLNLVLIVSNFLVGYSFLKLKFKAKWRALLISGLVALNPISISQINTFCVDTLIVSLFGLLMWNIFIFLDKDVLVKGSAFSMFIVSAILFNIKWTTLAYVFVVFIMLSVYLILLRKELFFKWVKIYVLAGVLGIFIMGFDPYVTNTLKFGHPFYPIYSKNPAEINKLISPRFEITDNIWKFMARANSPYDFLDKSWWWKFWRSMFAVSSNSHLLSFDSRQSSNSPSELKWPLLIRKNELLAFEASDVRLAGFGVWFSGAMILSVLILPLLWFKNKRHFWELMYIWVIILTASWLNPESWWARYVPFLWFLPVMTVYYCFKSRNSFLNKAGKILGLILVVNNIFIIAVTVSYQWRMTRLRIEEQNRLLMINNIDNMPVKIDFVAKGTCQKQYFEKGISFVETNIEGGIMENYFLEYLGEDEVKLMKNNYLYDEASLNYKLVDNVSNSDLTLLAKVFNKMEKVPLKTERK
jgi:hypothetical protein